MLHDEQSTYPSFAYSSHSTPSRIIFLTLETFITKVYIIEYF